MLKWNFNAFCTTSFLFLEVNIPKNCYYYKYETHSLHITTLYLNLFSNTIFISSMCVDKDSPNPHVKLYWGQAEGGEGVCVVDGRGGGAELKL